MRHLAAARGLDLPALAEKADGMHPRTLANATRRRKPQPVSLTAVYALGRALADCDQNPVHVAAEIVADRRVAAEILANAEPMPEKDQPKREPTGPARRQDTEQTKKGPKRVADGAALAEAS